MARTIDRLLLALKMFVREESSSSTTKNSMTLNESAVDIMPSWKSEMDNMPNSRSTMDKMPRSEPAMEKVPSSKPAMENIHQNNSTMANMPSLKTATNFVINIKDLAVCARDQLLSPLATAEVIPGRMDGNTTNKNILKDIPVVMVKESPKKLYLGRYVIKKSKNVRPSIVKDTQGQISGRTTSTSESSPSSTSPATDSSPRDSILSQQLYFFEKDGSNLKNDSPSTSYKRTAASMESGNDAKKICMSDIPVIQEKEVKELAEVKLNQKLHHFNHLLRNLSVAKGHSAGGRLRCKLLPTTNIEEELTNTAKWAKDFVRRSYGYRYGFIDCHCRIEEMLDCLNRDQAFHTGFSSLPVNIEGFVAAFTNPKAFAPEFIGRDDDLLQLTFNQDGIWVTLGCPPHNAHYFYDAHETSLEKCVGSSAKIVAVGPCGLDYTIELLDWIQMFVFSAQIRVAAKLKVPIVIECREADDDVIATLQKYLPKSQKIHLQGFTGDKILVSRWLSHFPNVYFGLSPVVGGVRSSKSMKEMVASIPINRILLESGASQTVPEDFKKVISATHFGFALFTAKIIGEMRKMSTEAVLKVCRDNTRHMYGI